MTNRRWCNRQRLCCSADASLLHDCIENPKQIQIDFPNLDVFAQRPAAFLGFLDLVFIAGPSV